MYKDRLGFQCRDEADDLRDRVVALEKERVELLLALRSRCVCDSKGYYDRDVAKWFDPGSPHLKEDK